VRNLVALAIHVPLLTLLTVCAIAGRIRARSCCAVADSRRDLRMRAAFDHDDRSSCEGGAAPEARISWDPARPQVILSSRLHLGDLASFWPGLALAR
jgi:hypothetical protein